MKQLSLFPKTNEQELAEEIELLKDSQDKLRKKFFHEHRNLLKMYHDLSNQFNTLIEAICHGRLQNGHSDEALSYVHKAEQSDKQNDLFTMSRASSQ